MTTAIVTTTINVPTGLESWVRQLEPGDVIVVAGDVKTPHGEVRQLLDHWEERYRIATRYVFTEVEERYEVARLIGWNSIQRRNLATLEALRHGPDVMFTVDDDNFPETGDHVDRVLGVLSDGGSDHLVEVSSPSGWFNVGSLLTPPVVHRGFPARYRFDSSGTRYSPGDDALPAGVHASLWLGAPDVDAAERWHHDPETTVYASRGETIRLARRTWCPFNSQATAYRAELVPLLAVPPGLGRYDDIWGSYLARRIMDELGWTVAYGAPYVRQDRNPHDVVRDLQLELLGMRHTDEFVGWLRDVEMERADPLTMLGHLGERLAELPYVPPLVSRFVAAWVRDVRSVLEEVDRG